MKMLLESVGKAAKLLSGFLTKNSPHILTGLAVTGVVTTTILGIKATPKAVAMIQDELYYEKGVDLYNGGRGYTVSEQIRLLGVRAVASLVWRCYLPTAAVGTATIGCILFSNSIHTRRNAALAGIYTLTEAAFKEYQEKVVETIGKNKELQIRDNISADRIQTNALSGSTEVIITGKGEVMCYDSMSGRYFKSDADKIRKVVNELNRDLMSEMFISLNEFYAEIGLDRIKLGDDIGWDIERQLIDVRFSTQLTENEEPCLVLNYNVIPKHI